MVHRIWWCCASLAAPAAGFWLQSRLYRCESGLHQHGRTVCDLRLNRKTHDLVLFRLSSWPLSAERRRNDTVLSADGVIRGGSTLGWAEYSGMFKGSSRAHVAVADCSGLATYRSRNVDVLAPAQPLSCFTASSHTAFWICVQARWQYRQPDSVTFAQLLPMQLL